MSELITITEKEGKQLVSAKELYEFLGYDRAKWARWSKLNIVKDIYFIEGVDYQGLDIKVNGNNTTDFAITLNMAKELAMLARSIKGKEARQYFIECETIAKEIQEINKPKLPSSLKEAYLALAQAEEEKEALLIQNENLNTVLDNLLEWISIIKVFKYNKVKESVFSWRKLKSKSDELGYKIKKAESPRFGFMNLYHVNAFRACYPQFDYNIKN